MTVGPAAVITLHPGDVALGLRGDRLETLLGSCVAVVLTDPRRTLGVMCHIVHSRPSSGAARRTAAYADRAFPAMVALLLERGINARLCEAYVYGGGNMFPQHLPASTVGDDNARCALETLAASGIRVLASDVGGAVYRQLRWTVGAEAPQAVAVPV